MSEAAQTMLDSILANIDSQYLSALDTAHFTSAIGRLYAALDYIHPFRDGNSRTLREFTRSLADTCGYTIDWGRFAQSAVGRDMLYIARDLSVNQLALPAIRHADTRRAITLSLDQFGSNRNLPDLQRDAIQPKHPPA